MKKEILKSIKGVVFDMDGLMFDSERIVKHSWNVAGGKLGYGNLGDENIFHTLGFDRERRKQYFLEKYGADFPFETFAAHYRRAFSDYVEEQGLPVKKGLHRLLETLNSRGIKMAVATSSGRSYALDNIRGEGISHYFTGIVSGDMVTRGKPDPEIYEKACALLELPPSCCLALEDAAHGILSAHRAGMKTLFVPDLVKDSSRIDKFLDGKAENLEKVAQYFEQLDNKI